MFLQEVPYSNREESSLAREETMTEWSICGVDMCEHLGARLLYFLVKQAEWKISVMSSYLLAV